MKPHLEEAKRMLRLADRDSEFDVVKVDPAELEQFVTETRRSAGELLDASVR